ncbi:MAG: aldo/keto reductase [Pseudomonadota bacterium]|nr:MAG: aldo/keto reductase [Pseudomonadota bacterium]
MRDSLIRHFATDPTRRTVLKTLGLGVAALTGVSALRPSLVFAKPQDIVWKTIPKTNEKVPAIGLGTHLTFDIKPGKPRENVRDVLKVFYDAGGRVIDTSPLYGMAEVSIGDYATALGITNDLFIANKIWATGEWLGDDSHALRQFRQSTERLWREQFDVMQCHSLVNAGSIIPLLKAWKKEGRIRYTGVTHHEVPYFGPLAQVVEKGDVDFVQVRYNIITRKAEERILKAAQDKGVAVMVNMPFEKARLFEIVKDRPLPDFASEFGATTWAQFYLKWIISHPAVTCVLPATTSPKHQADNMAALRGPLPDQKMRERMVKHMETIPGFAEVPKTPAYPGKEFHGVIKR